MKVIFQILLAFACLSSLAAESELVLRQNLARANIGDYIVTAQNKSYTALLVRSKNDKNMVIEEITLPSSKVPKNFAGWKQWLKAGSKGNTCWVSYDISLAEGAIIGAFSYTRNEWFSVSQSQNFLSTLLNLQLKPIPMNERKKIGPPPNSGTPDRRSIWQPQLIVEGQPVPDVQFDGWRTRWPKDGSELSGKAIEIYVPRDQGQYPSYFPYWLQVSGMVGKAKVRIIDSGTGLLAHI
jgi:hypothetical protein